MKSNTDGGGVTTVGLCLGSPWLLTGGRSDWDSETLARTELSPRSPHPRLIWDAMYWYLPKNLLPFLEF